MKLFLTSACLAILAHGCSGAVPHRYGPSPKVAEAAAAPSYSQPQPATYIEPEPTNYNAAPEPQYPEPKYEEPQYPAAKKDYCKTYYETEYHEQCVHYYDEVCYTTYEEHCKDVDKRKCQAIVTTDQVRQCVDVTELLCGLAETVEYEMVHTGYDVQKCHTVKERVCDTVYEAHSKTQDDYQCINLPSYNCFHKEKTIYDKVCRHETKFDCQAYEKPSYGGGNNYGQETSYGSNQVATYGSNQGSSYGSNDYSQDSYGGEEYTPQYECKNTTKVNCYDTPRIVKTLVCTDGEEKVCEKFPEKVPSAVEKQNCHDEDKRVCEMEARKQPKQVKKYVYKKQCRKVPRQICASADHKQLVPQCATTSYKYCDYSPRDKCEKVPKKHCFNVPKKVKKVQCDSYGGSTEDKYTQPAKY